MYLEHYGFSEKPFTITPNPRFIFLSKNHREVFAHLLYGIRQHAGFIELTGEVGTGKTTVLRTLLAQLEQDSYRLAFIFNPSLSAPELMCSIGEEFGLAVEGANGTELLARINHFLLEENAAGRTVVLVIDEAQNLAPEVLEQIRLLSNLETETDKLIQIILVGQPELGYLLEQPGLRQLSQRIIVRYHLRPMDFEDTQAYIAHRLRVAGARGPFFSPGAIRKIFAFSKGYPRLINIVCDRSLLVGYSEEVLEIGTPQVATAIRELHREVRPLRSRRLLKPALAFSALLLAGAIALLWPPGGRAPVPPSSPAAAEASPSDPSSPPSLPADRIGMVRRGLASMQEGENAAFAFNAVAHLWGERPVRAGGTIKVPGELSAVAHRRGMEIEFLEGSLDSLLKLDHPALIEVEVPGKSGWRYLALLAVREGRAVVVPSAEGGEELQLDELRHLWSGRAWVLWKNPLGLPLRGTSGSGAQVLEIQRMLQESGVFAGTANGAYDRATVEAIARFQQSRGIARDGRLGPQTLMLLYQGSPRFPTPRISAAMPKGGRP